MLTLRQRSMANSSTATRKSQWSLFERFCDSHSLVNLLCTKRTACLFIAELSRRHLEYNTVVSYVHSFTSLHHHLDHVGSDLQHFSVKEALAGLQRSCRELLYQKHAITLDHLHRIHRSLELRRLPQEDDRFLGQPASQLLTHCYAAQIRTLNLLNPTK